MRRTEQVFAGLLALLVAAAVGYGLLLTWQTYEASCPNQDVLHWDGNLRLALVLDRYQHLTDGSLGEVFVSHLRANTWPPLRPLLSLALLGMGGPSAELDMAISFVFFAGMFAVVLFAAWQMSPSPLAAATAFAAVAFVLLHTRELNAYALSAMLETQGMFFLVLVVLGLFRAYSVERTAERERTSVQRSAERRIFWLLAVAVVGLTLTKYPYAIMLFLAVYAVEVLRRPSAWWLIARQLLRTHYRGWRLLLLVTLVVVVGGLMVAGKVGYLGVNTRLTKRIIYLVCALIFVDFNVFAYRSREGLRTLVPFSARVFYAGGVLPSLLWIFVNPDRFSTILGGQFWIGVAKLRSSFFETLAYLFQPPHWALLLLALGFVGLLGLIAWDARRRRGAGDSLAATVSATLRRPVAGVLLVCWLQFVFQDLFNPNKQDRHVYHILPALLLCSALAFQAAVRAWRSDAPTLGWLRPASGALLLVIALAPLVARGGLVTPGYATGRFFCYTDTDRSIFDQARWVALAPDLTKRTLSINLFHQLPFRPNIRNQASEMDVLLRMRAIRSGGRLWSDHRYHWKSWKAIDRLVLIAPDCSAPVVTQHLDDRRAATGSVLTLIETKASPDRSVCVASYSVSTGKR